MSASAKRTRLTLTRLDERNVPSTVTATTTPRPFDFTGTGTLTTTTVDTSGTVPLTSTATTSVTVNGELDYTDNATGTAGLVSISGTGTGDEVPVNSTDTGGRGSFAQTVQAQVGLADNDGVITTPTPLTGTVNWLSPSSAAGIDLIGPQTATGTFDVSNFQLQAGWSTGTQTTPISPVTSPPVTSPPVTSPPVITPFTTPAVILSPTPSSTGTLSVTLSPKTSTPTDLSFGTESATVAADGSITLDFTADVTGNLMNAASEDTAATTVTAMWEGNGQSLATDVNVPIYWNAGQVAVHVEGLTPPSWATSLVVQLDANHAISESNEANNTWTVSVTDLIPPPPVCASPPPPVVASYAIVPGVQTQIQWLTASGTVLAQNPAMPGFNGPVSIASGDVNGDGIPDVAIAAGAGGGPRVRVLDGKTGAVLADFFDFDPSFRGGSNIALANLNGDGKMELISGAGEGGGPVVSVFDAQTGSNISNYFAYDPNLRSGVDVAAADLNGDGKDEIITTPGAGEGGMLQVLDGTTGAQLFETQVVSPPSMAGATLTASLDPISGAFVVNVTPDDGSSLLKFRSQLAAGEPLLVPVPTSAVTDSIAVS